MKAVKAKCKIEKETDKNNFNCLFSISLLIENVCIDKFYPLAIFLRWALSADSTSLQKNTIASHDQFKSIRIRENLG